MYPLAGLVIKSLLETLPGVRIESITGSNRLAVIEVRGRLSNGFELELERYVREQVKAGIKIDFVEMESKGAAERFKKLNQPYFAKLCQRGPLTLAFRIGNFYLPVTHEGGASLPDHFCLIAEGERLFVCTGSSKQELAESRRRAGKWDKLSHLTVGKDVVSCIDGVACYPPKGAKIKSALKNHLLKLASKHSFEPIGVRGPEVVWKFLRGLGPGRYAQLEVRESNFATGQDLFSLRCEGALVLRAMGSKKDLQAAQTYLLQLIADILKMGEIKEIAPLEKGGDRLLVLSARLEEVELARWESTRDSFELIFYIDRWIGVLIEVDKQFVVSQSK